jgi:hypothetical protein
MKRTMVMDDDQEAGVSHTSRVTSHKSRHADRLRRRSTIDLYHHHGCYNQESALVRQRSRVSIVGQVRLPSPLVFLVM